MVGAFHGLRLRPLLVVFLLLPAALAAQEPGRRTNPWLRLEYFREQRAYPFGQIPAGALQRARAELRRLQVRGLMPQRPTGQAAAWEPLGPTGIPIDGGSIGRLTTIAVHPDDPDVLYVGGAQGGVWKTTNGGVSWTPLTDGTCSLAMGSIAIDPVDPDIVYAGTGELHFSGDSYYGCGVLRSTDGGETWQELARDAFGAPGRGARTSRVVIDPATAGSATATTIYAATDQGLWRSFDSGATWGDRPVLEGFATALVVDPSSPSTLYAGMGYPAPATSNGVYKSTDGGTTWTELRGGLPTSDRGRVELAISPSEPDVLYASFQDSFDGMGDDAGLLGIWKTTDGGATWTKLSATGAHCASGVGRVGQCWYDQVIAVHPTDPSIVYFGGVRLFRSSDGGESFQDVLGGIHVDQHAFAFDPEDPATVYVGNDGGIYRGLALSTGVGWTSLNTNLAITQFYAGLSLAPVEEIRALGGTQDNGTLEYGGSPSWDHVLGADGGFTAIDHRDGSYAYAETQWTPNGFGGPRRRGPLTGDAFVAAVSGIDRSDDALFIPPLVMSPADPAVLYFGTERLYRTLDRGDSWTDISGGTGRGSVISALAPARSDPHTVYVGRNTGAVEVTRDGGGTWLSSPGLPERYVTDLAVAPSDAARAYVTFSGFNTGHVFRTRDGGASWTDLSTNLPDVPVNAVVARPPLLFVGTDLGVFRSLDDGGSWEPYQQGLPNVAVLDLAVHDPSGSLVAATHGRGMFVAPDAVAASLVASVELLSPPARLVVEQRARLDGVARTADGKELGDAVLAWSSSDPAVAAVDAAGLVTAVSPGAAVLTVYAGGRSDSAPVEVLPQAVLAVDAAAASDLDAEASVGGRLSLLSLRLSVAGHEAVRLSEVAVDARGEVASGRLLLVDDADADGVADAGEAALAARSSALSENADIRVVLEPESYVLEPGQSGELVVALELDRPELHFRQVRAALVADGLVAEGVESGLAREQLPEGQVVAVARTSVLEDDEAFALSENPVRSGHVVFNFAERPAVAGVYALDGRRVVDLLPRMDSDGRVEWDLTNERGGVVAAGVYLVVFDVAGVLVREKLFVASGGPEAGGTEP